MQHITTKQFQIMTDIQPVWSLMEDTYAHGFQNGVPAPFFEYAVSSSWMNKSYLHLNRLWFDGDRPVGFVFTEDPVTNVFFNLLPGYEALAAEMVEYAERHMPNFRQEQQLVLFAGQAALIDAAMKQGYTRRDESVDLICDFRKTALRYPLPEGFHFVEPRTCDPLKLAVCTWKGFDHEDKGPFENWLEEEGPGWTPAKSYNGTVGPCIAPSPHATHEYDVIIANEQEEYVCYSGMWWVSKNKLAYMEPLCTVPAFRGRGLAAAALSRHYARLKPLGAEVMTGGANAFYRRIGYEDGIHWLYLKKG